ncbi:hypothetical protein ALC57_10049 [Trachymyrmex cornetzi]|uniref:Uncharacterized protein n=1 Tax=Trachymyrmex cornetzi TaxID=471704 RepID=A0A195DXQ2_9HYME|nr:hypothetical protein ALC57_10049 [Trachymyrmex cornetzi]
MDSRLSETGAPIAQDPCKPGLNPERGVSRAREAKRKGVPIDRSRGIVEGHSKRPRAVFKLILRGQSPTQSSIMRLTDQDTDEPASECAEESNFRERAQLTLGGVGEPVDRENPLRPRRILHTPAELPSHPFSFPVVFQWRGLPVAEKPVRLMGDDESRRVKGALSAFCLDVILSLLHHLAPMATNYEAHVAYTSFTYFVSYRLNVWVNPSIAENKEVGRRDKRRRSVAEQLETLAKGVEVKEQKEDEKKEAARADSFKSFYRLLRLTIHQSYHFLLPDFYEKIFLQPPISPSLRIIGSSRLIDDYKGTIEMRRDRCTKDNGPGPKR